MTTLMESNQPLWKHQLEAIERAKDLPEFALLFDMGTGKTRTTIELMRHQYNKVGKIYRTLILCPLIICENWKKEILKFSKIPESEILIPTGTGFEKTGQIRETNASIIILNYDSLPNDGIFQALLRFKAPIFIADESHRLKNISAKRTKRATELADLSYIRYLLTGTPVLNSPMDLFSQWRILDGGKSFGKNFYIFRATYFFDKNCFMPKQRHFPNWQIKPGSMEAINKIIYQKAMRVTKAECLDLPDLIKTVVEVGMSPTQAKLYNSMKKDFIAFVENLGKTEVSVATLAITKALRLLQIVSGFVKTEDDNEIHLRETPKLSALKELLENITPTEKVLVWCVFKQNYKQIKKICEEIGVYSVEIHGDISVNEKNAAIERFNFDENTRVLIGHPLSGGIGISLTAASTAIFYSRGFSLEADLQAESRNYRGGSEVHKKITRIDLIVKDSLDEHVYKALANKTEVSEKVLRAIALEL